MQINSPAALAALALVLGACAGSAGGGEATGGGETGGAESGGSEGSGGSDDTGGDALPNLLANGGFELGESWQRPDGYVNHAWARTGDAIYGSTDLFEAYEGERSQKIWGLYSGEVPSEAEHHLDLTDLTEGDAHVLSARVFAPADDGISGGSEAVLFLRYLDPSGNVLEEHESVSVDDGWPRDTWELLTVAATVPEGAAQGRLGLRFTLASWEAGGSVYLDDVSWTSTGTGSVAGERLLAWHDEFDGAALDADHWTRLELPAYTYNNEVQEYTTSTDNADVADGRLTITARQEGDGGVTSARLVTDGKAEWTYGRMEAMAQVPSGVGTWPAFWMLPSDWAYGGWPDSGEIDVLEHVGCDPDMVYQSIHTGSYNHLLGTQQTNGVSRAASAAMHLYAVDWTEDALVFTVDGETLLVFDNDGTGEPATWPFDQDFHLILNLAWGGDWGGYCGLDYGSLPQEFLVDWVRVYQ